MVLGDGTTDFRSGIIKSEELLQFNENKLYLPHELVESEWKKEN